MGTAYDEQPLLQEGRPEFGRTEPVIFSWAWGRREAERAKIFGSNITPYNDMVLGILRSRYSHDDLMSGNFVMPTGKDFYDVVTQAATDFMLVVKAAAPFIAMIPGIGLGVSMAINAAASLATGDHIDTVLIDSVETAIPTSMPEAKKQFREAVNMGYAAARGQNIGAAAVTVGHNEALVAGGPTAAAAFDTGIAVGTGKGLQDAGFKVMGAWCISSDTTTARAIQFGLDVRSAAARGISVKDFLIEQAAHEFYNRFPQAQQALALKQAIEFLLAHPTELVNPQLADLAERVGIPIEAIRAAIICIMRMSDGSLGVDQDNVNRFQMVRTFGRVDVNKAVRIHDAAVANVSKGANVMSNLSAGGVSSIGRVNSIEVEAELAAAFSKGKEIAASNLTVQSASNADPSPLYKRGFYIGAAICQGSKVGGPGQDRYRSLAGSSSGMSLADKILVFKGYDVAEALMHGIANSESLSVPADPTQAVGFLAVTGLVGTPTSDKKTQVLSTLTAHPSVAQGASAAIAVHQGIFRRILNFIMGK